MKTPSEPPKPYLSVVVPTYRQEATIVSHLRRLRTALEALKIPYEIICVVDGISDSTMSQAKKSKLANLLVTGYAQNRGKGHAVRFGMSQARGEVIGFVDSGKDLDYSSIALVLEHMRWYGADAVVASKRHPVSKVIYPWQRRILSWGYQKLVQVLFSLNVKDTQVGMKFFRRQVVEKVLPRVLIKEFAFDIEMLAVAHYLGFNKIFEAPVHISLDFSKHSSVVSKGFIRTVFLMLWDTLAVFYRLKILRYYDDANRKNWLPNMYLEL